MPLEVGEIKKLKKETAKEELVLWIFNNMSECTKQSDQEIYVKTRRKKWLLCG